MVAPAAPAGSSLADRLEDGRERPAVGLVQAVGERLAEQLGRADREPGAEQRGTATR